MTKATIIEKIKAIIKKYGEFTTASIQAESSPIIATLGSNTCQLAEGFLREKVEAIIYVNDREESVDFLKYEDLKVDVLKHILKLANEYKTKEEEEL